MSLLVVIFTATMNCFLIFFVISKLWSNVFSATTDYKVELVQVLFRHGDRTIQSKEMYPNDPYNHTIYEPYGIGELTNKGKQRMHHLGEVLKMKYADLLGNEYKPGVVYAYSTNIGRTKMSLALTLAGLFPQTPALKWNENVNWIPIELNYNFESFDFLWTHYYCDEYLELWNATLHLPEVQRKLLEYRDFINDLANKTGLPRDKPQIAVSLRGSVRVQASMGLKHPSWYNDKVYKKLDDISIFRFDIFAYNNAMKKIAAGPTIRRFLRNIETSEKGNSKTKIYLYSGHDDNVATFIRTHNLTSVKLAEFGSGVVMEKLKGNDGIVYVRLLYYPGEGDELQVLKLDLCDEVCLLERYLEIMESVLPSGEGTECLYKRAYADVENVINGLGTRKYSNKLHLVYTN